MKWLDWEEKEDHIRFTETPGYKQFREILSKAGTITDLVHVLFRPFPPTKALEAPVTELVVVDVKDGALPEDLEPGLTKLCNLVVTKYSGQGVRDAVWGVTNESNKQYVVAIGWDSVQVRQVLVSLIQSINWNSIG